MAGLGFEQRRHEFLDNGGKPIVLPHQGGLDVAPGNSIAAIEDAWEQGYEYVETDGRATAGGELVSTHDHIIDGRLVSSLSVADRRAMQRDGHAIILITDVYDAFPGRISLDIKPDDAVWTFGDNTFDDPGVGMAIQIVRDHNAEARTCVASFATKNLHELRAGLPGAASTMSFEEMVEVATLIENPNHVPTIPILGDIASVEEVHPVYGRIISPESIAMLRKLRKAVLVWTINDPDDMNRLLDMSDPNVEVPESVVGVQNLGIDGFYTDAIRAAKAVMKSRGQWHERQS